MPDPFEDALVVKLKWVFVTLVLLTLFSPATQAAYSEFKNIITNYSGTQGNDGWLYHSRASDGTITNMSYNGGANQEWVGTDPQTTFRKMGGAGATNISVQPGAGGGAAWPNPMLSLDVGVRGAYTVNGTFWCNWVGANCLLGDGMNYTILVNTTVRCSGAFSLNANANPFSCDVGILGASERVRVWLGTNGDSFFDNGNFTLVVYREPNPDEWRQGVSGNTELVNSIFSLNITNTSATKIDNVTLWWNGTGYRNTSYAAGGGSFNFTTTLVLPLMIVNNTNVTFYWNYTRENLNYSTDNATQMIRFAYEIANFSVTPSGDVLEYENLTSRLGYTNASSLANLTSLHFYRNVWQAAGFAHPFSTTYWNSSTAGSFNLSGSLIVTHNGSARTMNSSNFSITVATPTLTSCGAGTNSTTLNYTTQNEETFLNLRFDLESTFTLWNNDARQINYTYAFNATNVTSAPYCLNTNRTIPIDSFQTYHSAYGGSFPQRSYFLYNASVSNVTRNITLYLLNSTQVTATKVSLFDVRSVGIAGAILDFTRYYPATNLYRTVAMILTDNNGEGNTYLTPNDAWFKVIEKENATAYIFPSQTIPCDPAATLCSLTLRKNPGEYDEFSQYSGKTASDCDYVNATSLIICTVTDTSGLMHNVRFWVVRVNAFGYTTLCDQNVSSSSASFSCNVTGIPDDVHYSLIGSFTNTELLEDGWVKPLYSNLWGTAVGLLAGLFVTLLLPGIGLWNPGIAIAMGAVAFGIAWAFGFYIVSIGVVIGVFLVAAIAVWGAGGKR